MLRSLFQVDGRRHMVRAFPSSVDLEEGPPEKENVRKSKAHEESLMGGFPRKQIRICLAVFSGCGFDWCLASKIGPSRFELLFPFAGSWAQPLQEIELRQVNSSLKRRARKVSAWPLSTILGTLACRP